MAIGVTNQRESVVVWDRNTGAPLYKAIIWLDNRTTTTVDELIQSIPNNSKNINYLQPLCGLPLSPYFSALKLRWLMTNVPTVKRAIENGTAMFGTIGTLLEMRRNFPLKTLVNFETPLLCCRLLAHIQFDWRRHKRRSSCYRCDQCFTHHVDEH